MRKSKSETNRRLGKHQVDGQRARILDAAEELFLRNGLDNTRMVDIAARAGITKVTLYRYFPNRDVIALEIQARMMDRIAALAEPGDQAVTLDSVRQLASAMIRNFDALRDAYRYMGMFDHRYLDHPPEAALAQWTKRALVAYPWKRPSPGEIGRAGPLDNRAGVVMSAVIWFLEKLALRGELTWSDPAVPLEDHLAQFEAMIMSTIDRFTQPPPQV
jgi:AcrR family transcriptional regulator